MLPIKRSRNFKVYASLKNRSENYCSMGKIWDRCKTPFDRNNNLSRISDMESETKRDNGDCNCNLDINSRNHVYICICYRVRITYYYNCKLYDDNRLRANLRLILLILALPNYHRISDSM